MITLQLCFNQKNVLLFYQKQIKKKKQDFTKSKTTTKTTTKTKDKKNTLT